ncbi:hypothetical protein AX17_002999 [Amanita inopinata Kibby_2008]|nr:hypothetical protein AX17_002999 [Amanita inopinata Kibby_2008]
MALVSIEVVDHISWIKSIPFRRGQTIVDKNKKALSDQTPAEGQYLVIAPVHLPPTMDEPGFFGKSSAFEMITTVDHENRRAAWVNIEFPRFLLNAERWQALSVDPSGKTKYETIEVFGGILAYFVKFFVGANLILGFNAQAEGLKKRAEQLYKPA